MVHGADVLSRAGVPGIRGMHVCVPDIRGARVRREAFCAFVCQGALRVLRDFYAYGGPRQLSNPGFLETLSRGDVIRPRKNSVK